MVFDGKPNARADMKSGALYAVSGEGGWVYYGQVSPEKAVAFFRRRDRDIGAPEEVLTSPILAVIAVAYPSITRALRSGHWKKLGNYPLADRLHEPRLVVQWPVGTLRVTVWSGDKPTYDTSVDDRRSRMLN